MTGHVTDGMTNFLLEERIEVVFQGACIHLNLYHVCARGESDLFHLGGDTPPTEPPGDAAPALDAALNKELLS